MIRFSALLPISPSEPPPPPQIEKDSAELVQTTFLKWLLGVNKYTTTMHAGLKPENSQ